MYSQVSAVAAPTKTDMPEINRRSANFHPSIWGDRFLTYAPEFLVSCPFECVRVHSLRVFMPVQMYSCAYFCCFNYATSKPTQLSLNVT